MDKEAWKQPRRQDPDYLTDLMDRVGGAEWKCAMALVLATALALALSLAAVQCSTCSAAQLLGTGLGLGWAGLGWAGQGNAEREAGKGGNGARWHRRRTQSTDKGGRPI